jgi:hypothetical protein
MALPEIHGGEVVLDIIYEGFGGSQLAPRGCALSSRHGAEPRGRPVPAAPE